MVCVCVCSYHFLPCLSENLNRIVLSPGIARYVVAITINASDEKNTLSSSGSLAYTVLYKQLNLRVGSRVSSEVVLCKHRFCK